MDREAMMPVAQNGRDHRLRLSSGLGLLHEPAAQGFEIDERTPPTWQPLGQASRPQKAGEPLADAHRTLPSWALWTGLIEDEGVETLALCPAQNDRLQSSMNGHQPGGAAAALGTKTEIAADAILDAQADDGLKPRPRQRAKHDQVVQ